MLNILDRIREYTRMKECTDMVMRTWRAENEQTYADFKKRIDAIGNGDVSVLVEMLRMAKACVPDEVIQFYSWLGNLVQGRVKSSSIAKDMTKWGGQHVSVIAECLRSKQMWMEIDTKTWDISLSPYKKPGKISVSPETPIEIWNHLPQSTRSYLTSQIDKLSKNSKGCFLFSKLERKMTYQALAYFSKLIFLTHAAFISEFLTNLYDVVIVRKDSLAYCMYYYVVFDHGLTHLSKQMSRLMAKENVDTECLTLIKSSISLLVGKSLDMGVETKATWQSAVNGSNQEIWMEVMFALQKTKGKTGNKKGIRSIDEIVVGNVQQIKNGIMKFLEENDDDICLAYLLKTLIKTGRIRPSIKYMTFHRAIEQFAQRHYGHDVPQKRYWEIKDFSFDRIQPERSYARAKHLIDTWTIYFSNCG